MNRHRCECSICTERGTEIERLQEAKRERKYSETEVHGAVHRIILEMLDKGDEIVTAAEAGRLSDAKHAALKLADERAQEANGLRQALQRILTANASFRAGMPDEWEGDFLQDACDEARLLLTDEVHEPRTGVGSLD